MCFATLTLNGKHRVQVATCRTIAIFIVATSMMHSRTFIITKTDSSKPLHTCEPVCQRAGPSLHSPLWHTLCRAPGNRGDVAIAALTTLHCSQQTQYTQFPQMRSAAADTPQRRCGPGMLSERVKNGVNYLCPYRPVVVFEELIISLVH